MDVRKVLHSLSRNNGIKRTADAVLFKAKSSSFINNEKRGNGGEKRIAHVSYHLTHNAGDTVLSKCVRDTVQNNHKVKEWNLIQVSSPVTRETIDRINDCDELIIGGGGLFLPDTNKNNISGWQWAISNELLESIKVPISVFSVGYNYFKGQKPSDLFVDSLTRLVDKSSFVGLRNRGSVEAVKSLVPDVLKEKISYQPCTTTVIGKVHPNLVLNKVETRKVAVNLAFDREDRRYGDDKEEILTQISKGIKRIELKGFEIYYVCHCAEDDLALPYLKKEKVAYKLVDLSSRYPNRVFEFYNKMDVVIGMRGHAQMIPFGLNCKIITLGSHDKMRWFLEDIDATDWYVDLTEDPKSLSERIEEVFVRINIDDKNNTIGRIAAAQDELWRITEYNTNILLD